MNIGIIGLGKMGYAIAYRLLENNHHVIGFDIDQESIMHAKKLGVTVKAEIKQVAQQADIIWLMLPAGKIVDEVIEQIIHVSKGTNIIIDGGNSHFKDTIRRADALAKLKIEFLDCGTSGGLAGKDLGFCLMIGGEKKTYEKMIPIFQALAMPNGYGHMGKSGAGHYVKMIHNGIEYALLQSYAEGFEILKKGYYQELDLVQISQVWQHGSIIRSWILHLAHSTFLKDQNFENIEGSIAESGMGAWTVEEAKEHNLSPILIEKALQIRSWSRTSGGNYATKIVSLLRNAFGGHAVTKKKNKKGLDENI